ncbi:MAG: T9SS type A sorting domain-containing protein [Saprospiraceae bacterium]|nr:T9SS type A sorting domain-containing protein [Saprospiraceae bacterium]
MRQTLLFFFFLIYCIHLGAQVTLSLSPEVASEDVPDPSVTEVVAHSFLKNIGNTTVTIKWFRNAESITDTWESAICDFNACYSTTVDSTPDEQPVVLQPGDSTNLDVHIRPNNTEGSAKIILTVIDVNDAKNTVEGTFLFNQTSPTVDVDQDALNIYPNPAIDYFELSRYEGIQTLAIFNVAGRKLRQHNVIQGQKFDVSFLDRGMYLVRLVDRRNDVVKTLRLNKR